MWCRPGCHRGAGRSRDRLVNLGRRRPLSCRAASGVAVFPGARHCVWRGQARSGSYRVRPLLLHSTRSSATPPNGHDRPGTRRHRTRRPASRALQQPDLRRTTRNVARGVTRPPRHRNHSTTDRPQPRHPGPRRAPHRTASPPSDGASVVSNGRRGSRDGHRRRAPAVTGGEPYEVLRRPQELRREVAAHGDGEGPERLFRRDALGPDDLLAHPITRHDHKQNLVADRPPKQTAADRPWRTHALRWSL